MDNFSWPYGPGSQEQFLVHRPVIRHLVLRDMDDDYTEPELAQILLELLAAVDGQQNIEPRLS